jgi:hypothetical protein
MDINSTLAERKDHLPVLPHVDHGPLIHGRSVQRDIETSKMRLPIVGIFSLGVGVVNNGAKRSPSELPNAAIGRRPMASLIPTGLPALSSMKLRGGSRNSVGIPSRIWNLLLIDDPITCSGGTPYTFSVHGRMNSTPPPDTMNVLADGQSQNSANQLQKITAFHFLLPSRDVDPTLDDTARLNYAETADHEALACERYRDAT